MKKLTIQELQELLERLELQDKEKQNLVNRIEVNKYVPYLLSKDEEVEISSGGQIFGSGGFRADYFVVIGNYEIIEQRKRETSFIYEEVYKIRPKQKPLVIIYYRKDECGGNQNPIRYFNKDIYIWL